MYGLYIIIAGRSYIKTNSFSKWLFISVCKGKWNYYKLIYNVVMRLCFVDLHKFIFILVISVSLNQFNFIHVCLFLIYIQLKLETFFIASQKYSIFYNSFLKVHWYASLTKCISFKGLTWFNMRFYEILIM